MSYAYIKKINGKSCLSPQSYIYYKNNSNKYVHAGNAELKNGKRLFFIKGNTKEEILTVYDFGSLADLLETWGKNKRIPIIKRQSLTPCDKGNNKKASVQDHIVEKKNVAASRKAVHEARTENEKEADEFYYESSSQQSDTDVNMDVQSDTPKKDELSVCGSPMNMEKVDGKDNTIVDDKREEPSSSSSSLIHNPRRSLKRKKVKNISPSTPLTTRSSRNKNGKSTLQKIYNSILTLQQDMKQLEKNMKSCVTTRQFESSISKLNDTLNIITKKIGSNKRQSSSNDRTNDDIMRYLKPDKDGNVELLPGKKWKWSICSDAALAPTQRKRANIIMSLLWPPEVRANLVVQKDKGERVPDKDYGELSEVLDKIQKAKPIPYEEKDSPDLYLKKWISDWLKNNRPKAAETVTTPSESTTNSTEMDI